MTQSIFISSAGDLADLRKDLSKDLEEWLDHNGVAHLLRPYLWEEDKLDGRLLSDRQRIQQQVPDTAGDEVPLTICLFGECCGTPLEDELDPDVRWRFDGWRAKDEGPGLLHPWPTVLEEQELAFDRGQYPLTGTVYELLSAHAQPEEADNLIIACCADRPVTREMSFEEIVFNERKLYARKTRGRSKADTHRFESEVYDPQVRALLNLLKHHARILRFVRFFPNEDEMRREVFADAVRKLSKKLNIASLNNPFKQSLAHWTIDDEKALPGRIANIQDIMAAMERDRNALILLRGRSGCGKSSLMQSGVMRSLRERDGSLLVAVRPTELMAGSGDHDPLFRLAQLIAETADVRLRADGPRALRAENFSKQLSAALEGRNANLVIGLDQFEEIIDELKLESERSTGLPKTGWWLVISFLNMLCGSPHARLIATLESARESSFNDLRIGDKIGLRPHTINVDATDDTVAVIAQRGFASGGLPLAPAVIEAIKRQWRAFENQTPNDSASPLPLACLFFHRLYERFADRAGATAGDRVNNAFRNAGSGDDCLLTLEDIGGEGEIAFSDIIQNQADDAWRDGGGDPRFADPIETDPDFAALHNFLTPLVSVDHDGQMQLRAVVESDADFATRRKRASFRKHRLLVPVADGGLRAVHQALIDRWSPGHRWFAHRKQYLQRVQRFRDDALFYHRRGMPMRLAEDGSTIKDAALVLSEHHLEWPKCGNGMLSVDEEAIRQAALAVFDNAEHPGMIVDGSKTRRTYAHLAAHYHSVDLLKRFVAIEPDCLQLVDIKGETLLHKAAWTDGPAVPFLIEQGVPLKPVKCEWNAIATAVSEKRNDNFDAMIDYFDNGDFVETVQESKLVHWAAAYDNLHVINYLITKRATIDSTDKYGCTALHHAAINNAVNAFEMLLPHSDIQADDAGHRTAISLAAAFGAEHVLSAYLNYEEDEDRLAAILHARDSFGDTPLMIATRCWQADVLQILLPHDLHMLGDPRTNAHKATNGDTLFHLVFRRPPFERPTAADKLRARDVVELLLRDGRLDPNLENDQGKTAFDLGVAFPEARRVLLDDPRVPKDYAKMTPEMRIEYLSSRTPTILSLLKAAPEALTDVHMPTREPNFGALHDRPELAYAPTGETGLDILVRNKNGLVLASLAEDPLHWPALKADFGKLMKIAAIASSEPLRSALVDRFAKGDIGPDEAEALCGASIDAGDMNTARTLSDQGAPLTLICDEQGQTVLHLAATKGDVERFSSVLALGDMALPIDDWGRRPSHLAAEFLADKFLMLESALSAPTDGQTPTIASAANDNMAPYLCIERSEVARAAKKSELRVLQGGWNDEWGKIEDFQVHVHKLCFYPDVPLIELRPWHASAALGRLCFLLHEGKLFRLNGQSPPIHQINELQPPHIDEETLLHYLAFFCFFVRGEDGPFLVVDRMNNGYMPKMKESDGNIFRAPRIWGLNEKRQWRVSALIYYGAGIFLADFLVDPGGMIEMLNDIAVTPDMPDRVDAPLDLRSLH